MELWFNSDDHFPPRFHAEKAGEWAIRVFFLRDGTELWDVVFSNRNGRPTASELKGLLKLVEANRAQLHVEWETKVCVKSPGAKK